MITNNQPTSDVNDNAIDSLFDAFYTPTEAMHLIAEGVTNLQTIDCLLREAAGFEIGVFETLERYNPSTHNMLKTLSDRVSDSLLPDYTPHHEPLNTVWFAPMESHTRDALMTIALDAKICIEHSGSSPSPTALVICSPLGHDVSSQVSLHNLPAQRTIGIDGFLPLEMIKRLTLMINPATSLNSLHQGQYFLGTTGKPVSSIRDSAGCVVQRILISYIIQASDIAQQSVLSPEIIDAELLKLGLGFPKGLLSLGDTLGLSRIAHALNALKNATGQPRYRPSLWLQRRAQLNLSLLDSGL